MENDSNIYSSKAILFDRDGIVNVRLIGDYVKNIKEFSFIPEFLEAFKIICKKGYKTFLITNQQGVGKGLMSESDLEVIHSFMQDELQKLTGFKFDGIYYCTDLANSGSKRRKPEPGMIYEAIEENKLSKEDLWFIGDSLTDVEAGVKAGIKTLLLSEKESDPRFIPTRKSPKLSDMIDLAKSL
ncbi:MAG: hypothetical protein Kapaf2KO_21320 [Candidatus Kapaibacteriales bacterium]